MLYCNIFFFFYQYYWNSLDFSFKKEFLIYIFHQDLKPLRIVSVWTLHVFSYFLCSFSIVCICCVTTLAPPVYLETTWLISHTHICQTFLLLWILTEGASVYLQTIKIFILHLTSLSSSYLDVKHLRSTSAFLPIAACHSKPFCLRGTDTDIYLFQEIQENFYELSKLFLQRELIQSQHETDPNWGWNYWHWRVWGIEGQTHPELLLILYVCNARNPLIYCGLKTKFWIFVKL